MLHDGISTYFGGTHGLVEAIYLEGLDSFDRAIAATGGPDVRLDTGRAYGRWALANPTHHLVMFGRAVPDFAPSRAAQVRARASFESLGDAVRRHGAADPAAAADHLHATIHGDVMLELVRVGHASSGRLAAAYEAGLRTATESPR